MNEPTLKDLIEYLQSLHPQPEKVDIILDKDGWEMDHFLKWWKKKPLCVEPTSRDLIAHMGLFEYSPDGWGNGKPSLMINN